MKPHRLHALAWKPAVVGWLAVIAFAARADIAVIVHPDSPLQALTLREVSDLYRGRPRLLLGQERLQVLDQGARSAIRERFFILLNGMDMRRLNAYWARLQFGGDTQPPVALENNEQVLAVVQHNVYAVGYVDAQAVNGAVRTVLRIKE